MALLKNLRLTESKSLQFRLEGFNVFNHAQFFGPQSVDGNSPISTLRIWTSREWHDLWTSRECRSPAVGAVGGKVLLLAGCPQSALVFGARSVFERCGKCIVLKACFSPGGNAFCLERSFSDDC